jgi:uncharacterized repeat protein (TIGR03803 family)
LCAVSRQTVQPKSSGAQPVKNFQAANLASTVVIHSGNVAGLGGFVVRPPRYLKAHLTKNAYSGCSVLAALFLCLMCATSASAQTYTVIHAFSGADGNYPSAGLTADQAGHLYGTTSYGGNHGCQQGGGCGTVYELERAGSGWVLNTIYEFQGVTDGADPTARVVFGPDGALYGTTEYGGVQTGIGAGYGTVFKLAPPAHVCGSFSCPWTKTTLYRFTGHSDGAYPSPGDLTFDQAGNVYGTTEAGGLTRPACFLGNQGCGVVFKLAPSNGGWTESVVYSFTGGDDGDLPLAGVLFDQNGNLYGTASEGGTYSYGTVYQLTPSGSGWTENTLHSFAGLLDGDFPVGLAFDGAGILYGLADGPPALNYGGVAYELTPSGNNWSFSVISDFPLYDTPVSTPTLHNGNIYGSLFTGGSYEAGALFELAHGSSGWSFQTLYSFSAQDDGDSPLGGVLVDASGKVYGTASGAGVYSNGVVFEWTP